MGEKKKLFIWAHDSDEHVKKPTTNIASLGWQKGSIPMASHVNWIFKTICKQLQEIDIEAEDTKEQVNNLKTQLSEDIGNLRKTMVSDYATKELVTSLSNQLATAREEIKTLKESLKKQKTEIMQAEPEEFKKLSAHLKDTYYSQVAYKEFRNELVDTFGKRWSIFKNHKTYLNDYQKFRSRMSHLDTAFRKMIPAVKELITASLSQRKTNLRNSYPFTWFDGTPLPPIDYVPFSESTVTEEEPSP